MIVDNFGVSSLSTEDFLIGTMQNIISAYKEDYVDKWVTPFILEPSDKVEDNGLFLEYPLDGFARFINKLEEHTKLLNLEGLSNNTWKKVLGGIEFSMQY